MGLENQQLTNIYTQTSHAGCSQIAESQPQFEIFTANTDMKRAYPPY